MHQRCRLQCLRVPLIAKIALRQSAQVFINNRNQVLPGFIVTGLPLHQKAGHFSIYGYGFVLYSIRAAG